ncbi:MAG: GGDEF domain-containing protein [Actinomycetota bacterium]|nr:GGDEF domain-containing protein [Actinomycetota bacterium]
MQRGKYLRSVMLIVVAFIFANLVLYFSRPEGVLLYWTIFVVPMVVAAMTYDVHGAVIIGLASVGAIAWWIYQLMPGFEEVHIAVGSLHHIVEISLGSSVFLGMGIILGFLARKHKRQQAILERLSIHDRLTGLYNYSYFLDRIEEERKRAERYEKSLSFAVFDIDHFKQFNDTFGHEKGNLVLKKVARTIKKNVRATDIVARYGGEEFVVLLPQAGKEEAVLVAERVRQSVEKLEFEGDREQPIVKRTISGGVATYPSDSKDSSGLIVKADEALYEAKESGRNKICIAQ